MKQDAVAVAILTLNERDAIEDCIQSCIGLGDVYVFDSGSTDGTDEVAAALGATVVPFSWDGKYPKKKQWILDYLQEKSWVVMLDADERLSAALRNQLCTLPSESTDVVAITVDLDYVFLGTPLKHGKRVRKTLAARPLKIHYPVVDDLAVANMWEVEGHYQPEIDGIVTHFAGRLVHDDPGSLYDYFGRHNRYSEWEAHLLRKKVVIPTRRAGGILRLPGSPIWLFLYLYVVKRGFLDGFRGFHFATFQSVYYWQSKLKARYELD